MEIKEIHIKSHDPDVTVFQPFFKLLLSPNCMFYFLQKDYKRDLETEIKGRGMQVSADTLDIQRAMKASEMASQVRNKWDSKFKTSTLNCV